MTARWLGVLMVAGMAIAQDPPKVEPAKQPTAAEIENQALAEAVSDANNSTVDLVRTLEGFLKKYPQTAQRAQVERELARDAIQNLDDRRIVLYGERALMTTPDDMLLLDRVARALLALGGAENAKKSLKYSSAFEKNIQNAPPPNGKDAVHKQEDRDRGQARALLYESRARSVLGEKGEAERLAGESFHVYASEEAAREWAGALERMGRRPKDALPHLADAFAIPDPHATDADRAADRQHLGELYRQLHHSEEGLGDLILEAYDRTLAEVEARHKRFQAIDPNFTATNPMEFTLTGLDERKLALASLKGSVVILDFWATWCAPCRAQHPLYEQVKQRFKDRSDVVFLSIDTDEDRGLVAPFLDQQKWSKSTVYFDDGLQRLLQVSSIPTTVMFDKQGRVASRMNGFLPEKFVDQLSARIESALQ